MPQAKKNKSKGTGRGSARSTGSKRSAGSAPARSASTKPRVWPTGRVVTGVIAALALIAGVILLVRT